MAFPPLYLNASTPTPFWNSQAIQVLRSNHYAYDTGSLYLDVNPFSASGAHRQWIQVTAGNGTNTRIEDAHVQLWLAPFSLAISPSDYLVAFSGSTGANVGPQAIDGASIDPVTQTLIPGTSNFRFEADKSTGLFSQLPVGAPGYPGPNPALERFWTTNPVTGEKEVHICAFANVYRELGSQTPPDLIAGAPVVTGVSTNFDPVNNVRHAQRNLTIRKHPANVPLMLTTTLAGNPDPEEGGKYWVEVLEAPATKLTTGELDEVVATTGPWLRRAKGRRPGLEIVIDRKTFAVPLKGPQATTEFQIEGTGTREEPVALEVGEHRTLEFAAKLPSRDFGLHVFDLVQRRADDDQPVGGARVTVLTAPEELLVRRKRRPRVIETA